MKFSTYLIPFSRIPFLCHVCYKRLELGEVCIKGIDEDHARHHEPHYYCLSHLSELKRVNREREGNA